VRRLGGRAPLVAIAAGGLATAAARPADARTLRLPVRAVRARQVHAGAGELGRLLQQRLQHANTRLCLVLREQCRAEQPLDTRFPGVLRRERTQHALGSRRLAGKQRCVGAAAVHLEGVWLRRVHVLFASRTMRAGARQA
jgi:hypothetical protein